MLFLVALLFEKPVRLVARAREFAGFNEHPLVNFL
jgi:hypothetical protein